MEKAINIKLKIWRQRGPKEPGQFVNYSLDNVPTDISFLEMLDMLNDTNDRVPFTDWYYSSTAIMRGFQNRTVQGGLFIKLLKFE